MTPPEMTAPEEDSWYTWYSEFDQNYSRAQRS